MKTVELHGKDGITTTTYEHAEQIAGIKLDRRRNYAIIDDEIHELAVWSSACSGCTGDYASSEARGSGCSECGYTGRRRHEHWVGMAEVMQFKAVT